MAHLNGRRAWCLYEKLITIFVARRRRRHGLLLLLLECGHFFLLLFCWCLVFLQQEFLGLFPIHTGKSKYTLLPPLTSRTKERKKEAKMCLKIKKEPYKTKLVSNNGIRPATNENK
jgi:hypothetical protein